MTRQSGWRCSLGWWIRFDFPSSLSLFFFLVLRKARLTLFSDSSLILCHVELSLGGFFILILFFLLL